MGAVFGCEDDGSDSGKSFYDVYRLSETLGSGNYGQVHICRQHDCKETLAVKIVDKDSDAAQELESCGGTRTELDIMSTVHHPNVIDLKEVFEDARFLYVVMECLPGGELFKVISDKQVDVYERDMACVGKQLFEALAYLHGLSIVHRDVKAQNILLTRVPLRLGRALQGENVKIIDFGLATRAPAGCMGEARLDLVCGSPAMCAPEIWSSHCGAPRTWKNLWGMSYNSKVDVWAAGIVLYLAMFGTLPFLEKLPAKLAAKICDPKLHPTFKGRRSARKVTYGCQMFLGTLLQKNQECRPTAAAACHDSWLQGARRTRDVGVVPKEDRQGAFEVAHNALKLRFPLGGLDPEELRQARADARRSLQSCAPGKEGSDSDSTSSTDKDSDSSRG